MSEPDPALVEAATKLLRLGVKGPVVTELLSYGPEIIERQVSWLPLRNAKRPAAFIVNAIRYDYSAPNPHRHAHTQDNPV